MCETSNDSICDLGKQDPHGCRFIYGDPGYGDWHFCQRTMVKGAQPGNAAHPPYCARHTKVCVSPAKAFSYFAGWEKQVLFRPPGYDQRMAVDVFIKVRAAHGGSSHD